MHSFGPHHPKTMFGWGTGWFRMVVGGGTLLGHTGFIQEKKLLNTPRAVTYFKYTLILFTQKLPYCVISQLWVYPGLWSHISQFQFIFLLNEAGLAGRGRISYSCVEVSSFSARHGFMVVFSFKTTTDQSVWFYTALGAPNEEVY